MKHLLALLLCSVKRHNLEAITVFLHNGHLLLGLFLHAFSQSFIIHLVCCYALHTLPRSSILAECLTDKLNSFTLKKEHEVMIFRQHLLYINWLQFHLILSRLKHNCSWIIDIGTLGFKHQLSLIPILLVDGPHERSF